METIGVIGVGKLGLCLALLLEKAGYAVRGFDNNAAYRKILQEKTLTSVEPGLVEMLRTASNFEIVDDLRHIYNLSTIFVVVNTPSLVDGSYDHSRVDAVVDEIARLTSADTTSQTEKLLVISCTTMPGYVDTVQSRLAPYNYHVCYNPEFIAQGDILKGMANPDMVLIGGDNVGSERLSQIYRRFLTSSDVPMHIMSCREAEITKISLNCFLTTKIAFANSIGDLVVRSGGDPSVVLRAIGSDSRVGSKFLRWGHGFGGPCLPRDNRALTHYANALNFKHLIGEVVDVSNRAHLDELVSFVEARNTSGLPYFFDSVVYKKNTTILEESQQLLLAMRLAALGRVVVIHDCRAVLEEVERLYPGVFRCTADLDGTEPSKYFDVGLLVR